MQISLPILHHPKDGYKIDLNRCIDLTRILKKRDTESWDRDFCVYVFEDENGIPWYIGMGRYYDMTTFTISKWLKSRPFSHRKDLLKKVVNNKWTCRIVGLGMTSKEAHILEAYMIIRADKPLSKRGAKEWDRCSLINKKRERKWERLTDEYLDDGNYTRFVA